MGLLKRIDSVVLFVLDIAAAAGWYADIFDVDVEYENPCYAYVVLPDMTLGFHPLDKKCPGGAGGTTVYWQVDSMDEAILFLVNKGATLYRGPIQTAPGGRAAMLLDPFGCTIGLNEVAMQR
ncbi:glyoxalase [Pigmentiphaga aceris]|uniref:Glyoxalase n=2 Tax=Pigmentiphaga aceris TaxID=1940612 RepID=A0A5C0B8R7_9BURK|nr:glyoxalase [Pigmentiphaga aceris]